jgi:hypothetical protein
MNGTKYVATRFLGTLEPYVPSCADAVAIIGAVGHPDESRTVKVPPLFTFV